MSEQPLNVMRDHAATEAFLGREQELRVMGWNDEDAARYVSLYQVQFDSALSQNELGIVEELERKYGAPPRFGIFETEKSIGV